MQYAYSILSNEKMRSVYDSYGEQGLKCAALAIAATAAMHPAPRGLRVCRSLMHCSCATCHMPHAHSCTCVMYVCVCARSRVQDV